MINNLVVVKCPVCGQKLSFKPVPNYKLKPITCPKCHHSNQVDNFVLVHDPASTPDIKTDTGNSDDTVPMAQTTATIRCIETGEEFPLKHGNNVLGRKASNPQADILFTDHEHFISRRHASVNLITVNMSTQIQLRDEKSANGTYVKGSRIPENSIVKINPGDHFKMGNLTFVCIVKTAGAGATAYDDDCTTM